jgi:hypothetical protein
MAQALAIIEESGFGPEQPAVQHSDRQRHGFSQLTVHRNRVHDGHGWSQNRIALDPFQLGRPLNTEAFADFPDRHPGDLAILPA